MRSIAPASLDAQPQTTRMPYGVTPSRSPGSVSWPFFASSKHQVGYLLERVPHESLFHQAGVYLGPVTLLSIESPAFGEEIVSASTNHLMQAEHSWVQAVCFSASHGLNTPRQKHLRPRGASPHGLAVSLFAHEFIAGQRTKESSQQRQLIQLCR